MQKPNKKLWRNKWRQNEILDREEILQVIIQVQLHNKLIKQVSKIKLEPSILYNLPKGWPFKI